MFFTQNVNTPLLQKLSILNFCSIVMEGPLMKTKSHTSSSRYTRSSVPPEGHRNRIKRTLAWIVSAILLTGLLAFTVLLVWAFTSRNMPALHIWHKASLSGEFTARDATPKSTLQDYLDQEERLFSELKENIFDRVESTDDLKFSRYRTGGPQDPGHWETNWNRTFELVPEHIQGGALQIGRAHV